MQGEIEILFSLAGRIHVLLRREINRIIDVEWLCRDSAYAKEVMKLALSVESEELDKLVARVEEVHPLLASSKAAVVSVPLRTEPKYMSTLR
ncbi:MAG: hypothetical protein KKH12_13170 [Gammaproteobacteria bacterium]|nr:hypothetical protein [Gammaproteobacteria bacterium]MBU1482608.1 hypothetical protein [Gammaproteobacteria bacterium]